MTTTWLRLVMWALIVGFYEAISIDSSSYITMHVCTVVGWVAKAMTMVYVMDIVLSPRR